MGAVKSVNAVSAVMARSLIGGSIALALLVSAASAGAQITNDSILEERTKELASQLRCPVCQGLSLQDSPSQLSQQMKQVVRDQLRAGKSPEEIKAYFVSKYGEWVLLQPKPSGMNLVVYFLPLFLLVGGAGLIVMMVKRWTATKTVAETEAETETETETETEALR